MEEKVNTWLTYSLPRNLILKYAAMFAILHLALAFIITTTFQKNCVAKSDTFSRNS